MNRNYYNTTSGKVKTIIAVLFLLAVLVAWAVTLATDTTPETWDTTHPIPNANISWEQTFHGGPYGD